MTHIETRLSSLEQRIASLEAKAEPESTCKPPLQVDDRALTPTSVAVSEAPVGDQQRSNFQTEVAKWMQVCFGSDISADQLERADRFTEEALELAQTMPGFTAERAHALVDYVFGRAVGERQQEVGGVMVTLAALCNTVDIEIEAAAETELARIWKKVEQIRAKQAAKPTGSALPIAQQADPYGPPIPHDGGSNVE